MVRSRERDRVLGSLIGASIGDALGGPLELATAERVRLELDGGEWIGALRPYSIPANPHGIWRDSAPRGTGTDDTRYHRIFMETVIGHGGRITPEILAYEYITRYEHPERYYPGQEALAKEQFRAWEGRCASFLGIRSTAYPDIPREVLASDCTWGGFPVITGLLTLAPAGLLWPADPERAYREAFHLAFWDLGYARDATALMAAIISAALEPNSQPREIVEMLPRINPYTVVMNGFTGRRMTACYEQVMAVARGAREDRELILRLAEVASGWHVFDPADVLNVPLGLIWYAEGDPVHALTLAVNHRTVDAAGKLVRTRDTDCLGFVTGAIVGAMAGLKAFPRDWVDAVIEANLEVYGFDLMRLAESFCDANRIE